MHLYILSLVSRATTLQAASMYVSYIDPTEKLEEYTEIVKKVQTICNHLQANSCEFEQ